MTSFGLYIHIPYCRHKCPYCDFNTYAVPRAPEEQYVPTLLKELELQSDSTTWKGRTIHSIFFGGGTPSLLSGQAIKNLLDAIRNRFELNAGAEITLEANPETLTEEKVEGYAGAGVNRISLGVQSLKEETLQQLGRDHSRHSVERSISMLLNAGITNLSVDLLYGAPQQLASDFKDDVRGVLELPLRHVSAYNLTVEPGTPFFQAQARNVLTLPEEQEVLEMMDVLETTLPKHGFQQYEISNFAQPTFESFHNEAYWMGKDYLGLGAGAHSFFLENGMSRGERWSNIASPTAYQERVIADKRPVSWSEELNREKLMFEFFYLGLRRNHGVSFEAFSERFEVPCEEIYGDVLNSLVRDGLGELKDNNFSLTVQGRRVSDSVFSEFIV